MAKWKNTSKVNRIVRDVQGEAHVIKPLKILELDLSPRLNAELIRDGHIVEIKKKKKQNLDD